MCNYGIFQLGKSCLGSTSFKLKRKNIEHSRINIIDGPVLHNLLVTMLYYSKSSSEAYHFLHFREIFFHGWCQCRKGECECLRLATCFSHNHRHAVNTVFVYIEIIKAVFKSQVIYDQQEGSNA